MCTPLSRIILYWPRPWTRLPFNSRRDVIFSKIQKVLIVGGTSGQDTVHVERDFHLPVTGRQIYPGTINLPQAGRLQVMHYGECGAPARDGRSFFLQVVAM